MSSICQREGAVTGDGLEDNAHVVYRLHSSFREPLSLTSSSFRALYQEMLKYSKCSTVMNSRGSCGEEGLQRVDDWSSK